MMPDLCVQLMSKVTGAEYGTLSYTLPRPPLQDEEKFSKTWIEVSQEDMESEAMANLKNKKLAPLKKNVAIDEGAYSVFVDVFAAEKGWLKWNEGFFIGRCLQNHRLFTIRQDEHKWTDLNAEESDDDDGKKDDDSEEDELTPE